MHNGKVITVERTSKYSPFARRELFQPAPKIEEHLSFTIPETDKSVEWMSDIGAEYQDSLTLLMLDFKGTTPYIVTLPVRCHSYNKWGRPNPPYVFFKFDGTAWQRVMLDDFPSEFKRANVMIGGYHKGTQKLSMYSAEAINQENSHMPRESRYKREFILRPVKSESSGMAELGCEKMVYYKGGWIMPNDSVGRAAMDRKEEREKNRWYLRLWREINGN